MKIQIRDNVIDKNLIKAYKNTLNNLDEKIIKLIEQKDFTMLLTHDVHDILDDNFFKKLQKDYVENMFDHPYRGMMTNDNKDDAFYIAVFEKHLKVNELEGVLYHEIGHFLDGFNIIEKKDPNLKLFLSGSEDFQNAYKNDLTKNFDKIKDDKRYRLIHYVENSTPDNINPTAVVETFAEAFMTLNNKVIDEKIIDLYFPNIIEVARELLNKTHGLKL